MPEQWFWQTAKSQRLVRRASGYFGFFQHLQWWSKQVFWDWSALLVCFLATHTSWAHDDHMTKIFTLVLAISAGKVWGIALHKQSFRNQALVSFCKTNISKCAARKAKQRIQRYKSAKNMIWRTNSHCFKFVHNPTEQTLHVWEFTCVCCCWMTAVVPSMAAKRKTMTSKRWAQSWFRW